jgi:hypothetical protein
VEAAIDDFVLLAGSREPQGIDEPLMESGGFALHSATPNPFRVETSIRFDLTHDGPVRVGIYDVSGRRIQSLFDRAAPAGSKSCFYYSQLESGGVEISRPITFVR